ncbi:MAG: YifB family Mg chelatase-like AAA ATPase [Treponema sp.]|nr:YifB family Mg chelatase-like AAA ATPase [Treponema sp.]
MQIVCFSPFGFEGSLVSVEVDLRRGIPAVDIVGLADGAVKESRERMRSAIRNCGYEFPPERVLISLSPADVRKEGAGFDLAIALAVLKEKEEDDCNAERPEPQSVLVMGELELNGRVRPVRGINAAVNTAFEKGITHCIVPAANGAEAREVRGMKVFEAENLCQAFRALMDPEKYCRKKDETDDQTDGLPKDAVEVDGVFFPEERPELEYAEVRNQQNLVRGLQVAAAGGHNLIAFGPPGCGKSLALQKFQTLLPLLDKEQAVPVTRIYSIAGLLPSDQRLMRIPPFRQPHQTASIEGMCGGGVHCSPGEISLAHNGVLFLDEGAEFKSSVLQMLRVPMESGMISLSRAGRSTCYPARFQLLIATNPCPCGFYGSKEKLCLCSSHSIEQYWKKFSGPLLDRVDIRVQVDLPFANKNESETQAMSTSEVRKKIALAVRVQKDRQNKRNSSLDPSEVCEYCICSPEAEKVLDDAKVKYSFSPRAVSSCLKTARTIADMENSSLIEEAHMLEAVMFRSKEGGLDVDL